MKDLTKGSVLKNILLFAAPLAIGNIFQLLYSFADSLIVGNLLGVNELAGVGAVGSLNFFVVGFAGGMSSGFAILVARHFGAKDEKAMKQAIGHSVVLSIVSAVIMTVLTLCLLRTVLTWMHTPADIIEHSYAYIRVIFGGLTVTMLYNTFASVLRAVGDSRTPLYFLMIASVVNIGLDLLLIGAFHTGVEGAAIATIASQILSVVLCLLYVLWKYRFLLPGRTDYQLKPALVKELMGNGLSLGFISSFISIGSVLVQSALNSLGTLYVAANTAAGRVCQIFMQPLLTLGTAMTTFGSQNLGAGKLNRVKQGLKATCLIAIGWSVVGLIFTLAAGEPIIGILVKAADSSAETVKEVGAYFLRMQLVFFPFLGLLFVYRNTLQGIGNQTVPLLSGVLELIVKVVTAFWLTSLWGYDGIVFSEPIAWVLCMMLLLIGFYRDPKVKALSDKTLNSGGVNE